MIYNKSGNQLISAYGKSGNSLSVAYDKSGSVVFAPNPVDATIMTFNVGKWYGYGGTVPSNLQADYYAMHEYIFEHYDPDFLAIQEYNTNIGSYDMAALIRETCPYYFGDNGVTDGRSISSKYELTDITTTWFAQQPSNENRYYLKSYVYIGGRKICFVCLHYSYKNNYPYLENDELMDAVANEDYAIIMGDINIRADSIEGDPFQNLIQPWIDAGYNSANGEDFGLHYSFYATDDGNFHVVDNIWTTPNITINSVVLDETKTTTYAELVGTRIDHMPLLAYVTIN